MSVDEWLCIAGGPNVEKHILEPVFEERPTTITCNAGIEFISPDYYWLSDPRAIELYKSLWKEYLQEGGNIVTRQHTSFPVDETLTKRIEKITVTPDGPYYVVRASGVYCLQVARNKGADVIHMAGYEGYSAEEMQRDKTRKNLNECMTESIYREIEENPDIQYVWYGESKLRKTSEENLTVI